MGESRFPPSRRSGGESNEVCSPRSRHSFPLALDRFASLAARLRQLWRRRWRYDSPTHSDGPDGHGRKCASDVGLGRQRWGDQLLREALRNDGRTLHANRDADNYELRRHGLTNGTKYYYVVSAYSSAGQSADSTEVSATPTGPPTPPSAPTNLTATASNAQVGIIWTASTGATSYNVKRSTTSGSGYVKIGTSTAAAFTDMGLTNGTTYYYVVSGVNASGEGPNSSQVTATPVSAAADVTITIDPTKTKPISPWIYGINFYSGVSGAPPLLTLDRAGGNRWTAYNWVTNASNAGSDYIYNNDNYLSSSNVPAEAVRSFIAGDQAKGVASLVTFQLQGLVSADENGPVSVANPPDLTRFKRVVDKKSTDRKSTRLNSSHG